jgi:hypothetical protein
VKKTSVLAALLTIASGYAGGAGARLAGVLNDALASR